MQKLLWRNSMIEFNPNSPYYYLQANYKQDLMLSENSFQTSLNATRKFIPSSN